MPVSLSFIALSAAVAIASYLVQRAFVSPLSDIPGPSICRFTPLWLWYHTYIGDECTAINKLHKQYGPVVRIGPNDCVISDGSALAPIYSERGGFLKAPCYKNFDFDGHPTIFSALDPAHRAKRSKAVASMFSTSSIRDNSHIFENRAREFAARLKQDASSGKPIELLTACRRLGLDTVCSFLFDRPYNGLLEPGEELSASAFVDSAVAIGKVFLLPNWLFLFYVSVMERLHAPSSSEKERLDVIERFGASLASSARTTSDTYPSRLKAAGISDAEIAVQCKDLIFAGTDSSGTVLAKTCWWLCKRPDVYHKLRAEVLKADEEDPSLSYNPQTLPYLDAVVREGLRLGQANPSRFPRSVPASGWSFTASNGSTYFFPAGTVVGCQTGTLHFNADVFKDPTEFIPERWLDNPSADMQRDFIPFNLGARQCIARNMAQHELLLAFRMLARQNTLANAEIITKEFEVVQWFNSKTTTGRIEVRLSS